MADTTFATAINCMDGRLQLPVKYWVLERFKVDFVDMITEPGPDRILAENISPAVESIKERVLISVEKHHSRNIIVIGHADCAGNPVSKEEHLEHIKLAIRVVKGWGLPVSIFGVWLDTDWKPVVIEAIY